MYLPFFVFVFFFKQKTAYEMRISDWSSDVCSSDLPPPRQARRPRRPVPDHPAPADDRPSPRRQPRHRHQRGCAVKASFRVYVDESGDEGFVFRPDGSGSSRWLVLSAGVTRAATDRETVKMVDGVRTVPGRPGRSTLHCRTRKHEQTIPYVRPRASTPHRPG